jgi:hypothetical protein
MWLGYMERYPDYWTQGETLAKLEEALQSLYVDIANGGIPVVNA